MKLKDIHNYMSQPNPARVAEILDARAAERGIPKPETIASRYMHMDPAAETIANSYMHMDPAAFYRHAQRRLGRGYGALTE